MAVPVLESDNGLESVHGSSEESDYSSFEVKRSRYTNILRINEILEHVLIHLPMKDLLLVQRVSSRWRELIKHSPSLQERLFLKPRLQSPMISHDISVTGGKPERELNPLLEEHMPMWFKNHRSVTNAPWAQTVARLAILRREASWRQMLLTQPPFTVFEVVDEVSVFGGTGASVYRLPQPNGVRMGVVYDRTVHSGSRSGPHYHFYTLMDGQTSGTDDARKNEVSARSIATQRERVFGGEDVFTLVSMSTIGCTEMDREEYRQLRLFERQLTSAGAEDVDIVKVASLNDDDGRWSREGWRKRRR